MANEREQDCSDCGDNINVLEECIFDDLTQLEGNNMDIQEELTPKRQREYNDDEEWQTVIRNSKKKTKTQIQSKSDNLQTQICVTSKEKLPKQFALAKLLQQNNIGEVEKVKYVNPYKILITFENELSAEKFLLCSEFDNLNWRRQKTWELGLSHGIIRDIDLDISEEELLKYIISEKEIVSLKRLSRKIDEGWITSETIRIGFKGSSLPTYIYLYDIKIKVEPYVFPVTQCSKCWRFGHAHKMCPSYKTICPKCGNNHSNFQVKLYKCANCSGGHMAISKNCPIYKKEKRIRELMSEFNCTYQRALTTYVPPSPQSNFTNSLLNQEPHVYVPRDRPATPNPVPKQTPLYSEVTRGNLQPDSENDITQMDTTQKDSEQNRSHKKKKKKKKYHLSENVVAQIDVSNSEDVEPEYLFENPTPTSANPNSTSTNECHENKSSSTFTELLQKLRKMVTDKENGIVAVLKTWFKILLECINNFVVNLIPNFSSIKNLFTSNYG